MKTLQWLALGILVAAVLAGCGEDATPGVVEPKKEAAPAPQPKSESDQSLIDLMKSLDTFAAACESINDPIVFSERRDDLLATWELCKAINEEAGSVELEKKMLILQSCLDEIEKVWAMTLGKKVPLDEHGTWIVNPINTWSVELASVSPQAFEAFQEIDEVREAAMAKGVELGETHRLWLQSVKSFAPLLMKEIRKDCSRL